MFGGAYFAGALFAGVVGAIGPLPAASTDAGIVIGGVDVTARVRKSGVTIHDILNDAPNTATLVVEGDAPAVGQRVQIAVGPRSLFTGSVQTIDQAFESLRKHKAWQVTAIDDTAAANQRRPFGTWVTTSATTIAQYITATFAPGFSASGIAAGLPAVSIVFDGADPLIVCLSRLATAIGGYCKVDDRVVYLFLEDTSDPPAAIDPDHRFLMSPPVQMTTDSSQIRTRVYGKGYGEPILADVAASETLIPIQNGAMFPALGGRAIAAVTADGAQSEQIAFTGVSRPAGGTLVGPGAAPANAPTLALAGGGVTTNGVHGVGVVYVTAAGTSIMGPVSGIDVNPLAAPGATLTPGVPVNGSGPDAGSHDYVVTFTTGIGETLPGPASAAVTTSASVGEVAAPTIVGPSTAGAGTGVPNGQFDYRATFVNAKGETTIGAGPGYFVTAAPVLTGQLPAPSSLLSLATAAGAGVDAGTQYYVVTFGDNNGDTTQGPSQPITVGQGPEIARPFTALTIVSGQTGGNMVNGAVYVYGHTNGNATGETDLGSTTAPTTLGFGNSMQLSVPVGPAGTTRRMIYRGDSGWGGMVNPKLVGTINDNGTTNFVDGTAENARGPAPPSTNGTSVPYHVVNLTNVPIGPAGTTNRKIWRLYGGGANYQYAGTVAGNLTTAFTDTTPNANLGATVPQTNTTGTMVPNNQITVTQIPTGPAGVTSRRLYRRQDQTGAYGLVKTIGDNTTTSTVDTASSAGAAPPISNTTGTAVQTVPITAIPLGPGGVTGRKVYRRFNGAGTFKLLTTLANNTATTFTDATRNVDLGPVAPSSNTAVGNQIALTNIPVGGSTVTGRWVFMSLAGTSNYHLVLPIGDNTTTTGTINTSDAQLATQPAPPTSDTSGLQQPQGQVGAGSTTLIVASSAPFAAGGGWVITGGGQVVRYTGISGQTLTGVPATGPGAIVTTVLYGQQATPSPTLVGVTGLTKALAKGSAVHIWIQRDDTQAQAEQAARTGGDGIVEYLIVDARRGVESLTARCDADLFLFARPLITVTYATRDLLTRSGKQIVVKLPSQGIDQVLTIQEVTITEIDAARGLAPRFTVKASNVRFTLEDTLRRMFAAGLANVNS